MLIRNVGKAMSLFLGRAINSALRRYRSISLLAARNDGISWASGGRSTIPSSSLRKWRRLLIYAIGRAFNRWNECSVSDFLFLGELRVGNVALMVDATLQPHARCPWGRWSNGNWIVHVAASRAMPMV